MPWNSLVTKPASTSYDFLSACFLTRAARLQTHKLHFKCRHFQIGFYNAVIYIMLYDCKILLIEPNKPPDIINVQQL